MGYYIGGHIVSELGTTRWTSLRIRRAGSL